MIQVEDVKKYLRIPYEDDDDFIAAAIENGYDYLRDAVDYCDELLASNERFARKADMWVLTQYCPDAYDKREGGTGAAPELGYAARAMLMQLQLYTYDAGGGEKNE